MSMQRRFDYQKALPQNSIRGLNSSGPNPALAEKLNVFGQFIGDWECEVVSVEPDGKRVKGQAEWHFGWVLDGRASRMCGLLATMSPSRDAPISECGTTCASTIRRSMNGVWFGLGRDEVAASVLRS
jgi:hypothetical protein